MPFQTRNTRKESKNPVLVGLNFPLVRSPDDSIQPLQTGQLLPTSKCWMDLKHD